MGRVGCYPYVRDWLLGAVGATEKNAGAMFAAGGPAANMALPAADGGAAWARALLGPRERRAPAAEPEPAGLLELAPLWVPVAGADGGDDPPPPSAFYMGPPTWRPLLFEG